ncbi:MAG: DUF262 domain-containing protein [Bryobacteraceae bacterium]|nr:DUF262 domain-containing protein [Bryobacteraceae bacterium]
MPAIEIPTPGEENPILEELTSLGEGSGLEAEQPDPQEGLIRAPFDPSEIDVITQARTVDLLLTRLREGEMDLSPDFQRRANIWDEKRKTSLIESMLLRIPIPSLYVSENKAGDYTVVDGLQRLCAITHFVKVDALNRSLGTKLNPLRLNPGGLQSLREYKEKSFDELPRPLQRRINETELTLHVIRPSTPSDVKFNIFSRINQGGLPLTAQEIRNAVYPGVWRQKVRNMAESKAFREATQNKIKGERMEDIELVLRFVAHYTFDGARPDDQNLDDFLNSTVDKRSMLWNDNTWTDIEHSFYRALDASPRVFGRFAFRKYYGPNQSRRPINRGLFETETVLLARHSPEQISILADRSGQVLQGLAQLFENEEFANALLYATGRGMSSNKRLELLGGLFAEVLNA